MYFLYLLILCYTSILLTPVNTYVVLAGNLNDFRSLTKKYAPKSLVGQIKAMILENGHKYYKEPSKDDEQDGMVEYLDDSQQDDSYEVTNGFKTRQQKVNIYEVNSAPKVEPIAPLATPNFLTIDDIVEKVKQKLFHQILDKSVNGKHLNAQANPQSGSTKTGGSLAYKYFPKKSSKVTGAKTQAKNRVYKPVPMKVIKEEVQYEATYEDTLDKDLKPQIQYSGQESPKKGRFVNTQQYEGGVKKVRFVKQVLVPVNSNQGQSAYVPQPSMVQQPMQKPSLGQQPSDVQLSNLEPKLSLMQKPNMKEKSMYQLLHHQANIDRATIMNQLAIMQQKIEQLNRTAQQQDLTKESPSLEIPQLKIEAVEGNFKIIPNPTADVQKTNDGNEDQAEPSKEEADENVLSGETTIAAVVTEPSTKALTVPGKVDNEQFTEENEVLEDSAGTVEKDDEATEKTTPEGINEEEDVEQDPKTVKGTDKDTKLDANTKVHTQEFGNLDAGEPIVAKTYNFDKPNVEAVKEPVNSKIPVHSARKVMLF